MLTVVDHHRAARERRRGATESWPGLQQRDIEPCVAQVQRGGYAGQPAADDNRVLGHGKSPPAVLESAAAAWAVLESAAAAGAAVLESAAAAGAFVSESSAAAGRSGLNPPEGRAICVPRRRGMPMPVSALTAMDAFSRAGSDIRRSSAVCGLAEMCSRSRR